MVSSYIKWVSLNNRLCQARPALVNINSNEPFYNPVTVRWICNIGGRRCNTTDDQYAWIKKRGGSMGEEGGAGFGTFPI